MMTTCMEDTMRPQTLCRGRRARLRTKQLLSHSEQLQVLLEQHKERALLVQHKGLLEQLSAREQPRGQIQLAL
jgi:hypothetical protein